MAAAAAVVTGARYVALAGGGARGMAYVGALQALRDSCGIDFGADRLPDGTRRLAGAAGTSIGALYALMLVLGYSVAELKAQLDDLCGDHLAEVNPLAVFTRLRAADDGSRLRGTISRLIARKLGAADVSLAALAARTGAELVTVATDATASCVRYLRPRTDGAMSTVAAVYASMALPLLFPPLRHDGHELQDGGGMDNLPSAAFGDEGRGRTLSLGLHWAVDLPPDEGSGSGGGGGDGDGSVLAYLGRSMYCALYPAMVAQWCLLRPEERAACIMLDVTAASTVELDLTPELKERVRAKGYADTAAAVRRMAAGLPPQGAAARFARRDDLPHYLHALLDAAAAADRAYSHTH